MYILFVILLGYICGLRGATLLPLVCKCSLSLSLGDFVLFLPTSLVLETLPDGWICVRLSRYLRGFVGVFWDCCWYRCLILQQGGVCQDLLGLGGGRFVLFYVECFGEESVVGLEDRI